MGGIAWWIRIAFAACCAIPCVALNLGLVRSSQAADVAFPELSNDVRVHLQRVDSLLSAGQPAEALENLRRVMNDGDGALIEIASPHAAAGFHCYLPVRAACHMKLAEWHTTAPEMVRLYRQQVDGAAQRWLAEALESGQEELLRKLVEQYFCSSYGDDALYWLGEFAFQRGDYASARAWWEQLVPSFRWASTGTRLDRYTGLPIWLLLRETDPEKHWDQVVDSLSGKSTGGRWLAYPDTDLDVETIRARLVLASIMQGHRERARIELDVFQRLAPQASGRIGGKQGILVERLQQLFEASLTWSDPAPASDWPTFGGNPWRARSVSRDMDLGDGPVWQVALPRQSWIDPVDGANRLRIGEDADRLLSFHPVVANNLALVGTDDRSVDIQAIDLRTGSIVFQPDPPMAPANYDNRRSRAVPRFTMTCLGDRLYVCADGGDVDRATGKGKSPRSRLVALDLRAEGRRLFDIDIASLGWEGDWSFEGSPVGDASHLYIAVRRLDAVRDESHVACFDIRNGRHYWRRFICAAPPLNGRQNQISNNVLTLDQGVLYYNTNAGAVAAVSANDGVTRWLARYPRAANDSDLPSDFDPPYRFRDLNPCLVQDGLVYVAPADCSRLFALDVATGQLIWTTPEGIGSDILHLLGVSEGHLLGSGEGLYWFDAYNGQFQTRFSGGFHPSEGHARQHPRGHGRGLLVDKNVYWPTRDSIFVFEQRIIKTESGWKPELVREIDLVSRNAAGGNLVMAGGVLLIASGDRLYAFNKSGN